MKSITFDIGIPHKSLSPNARSHWGAKSKAAAKQRDAANLLARAAAQGRTPRWPRATISIVYFHKVVRRRDRDNALGSLKSAIDGLRDAGIIEDDCGVRPLPVEFQIDRANPRVQITVTPE